MRFAGLFGSLTGQSHAESGKPCEDASAMVFSDGTVVAACIFDGLGGLPDGAVAAHVAADTFTKLASDSLVSPIGAEGDRFLPSIFESMHQKIIDQQLGCSTTATALHAGISFSQRRITYSALSVGDSRLYVFLPKTGKLKKITVDDADWSSDREVSRQIDEASFANELSDVALHFFRHRNVITSALGADNEVSSKLIRRETDLDAWFVLTTDGVHDNLTTSEICQCLAHANGDPIKANGLLLQMAEKRSMDESHFRHKKDDISSGIIFLLDI